MIPLIIDTETQGLDIFGGHAPTWVNWRFKGRTTLCRLGTGKTEEGARLTRLSRLMQDPEVVCVFHNAPFDLCVLAQLPGAAAVLPPAERVFCTLAGYHLIDPSQKHGLLSAAKDLLGYDEKARPKATEQEYATGDLDPAYMAFDLEVPEELYRAERHVIDTALGMLDVYRSSVEPVVVLAAEMRIRGIPVNLDLAGETRDALREEVAEIERSLGMPDGFTVNKKQKIAAWFDAQYPYVLPSTDTGAPSLDSKKIAAQRESIAAAVPPEALDFLDQYLRASHLETLARYCDNYRKAAEAAPDRRIHPGWNPSGTITDRFSCSPDTVMNIPKRDEKWGPRIRRIFYPVDGRLILAFDYAGIEFRLFADESGDPNLIEEIANHGDPHRTAAQLIYKKVPEKFARAMRVTGKHFNFLRIYGGGFDEAARLIEQFSRDAQIPPNLIRNPADAFQDWNRRYPRAAGWAAAMTHLGRQEFRVRNRFGRCIPVPPGKPFVAANYLIQGTVSQLIRRAMTRIRRAGIPILSQIHDELWHGPFTQREADEAAPIIEAAMTEDAHAFRVPIEVERSDLKGDPK